MRKFFSYLLDGVMRNKGLEQWRKQIVKDAHGVVLEIGFGSGLNLPYYQSVDKVFALDPSRELWNLAQDRMRAISFPVTFLHASAEHIPLPDQSVDTVVGTWTFCSVQNPSQVIAEIRRVLKPGGSYLFIEHSRSDDPWIARWQQRLTPLWSRISGGCHLNRNVINFLQPGSWKISDLQTGYKKRGPFQPKLFQFHIEGRGIKI